MISEAGIIESQKLWVVIFASVDSRWTTTLNNRKIKKGSQ
jgi:hypothetical protein